jgi:hypothetical protein
MPDTNAFISSESESESDGGMQLDLRDDGIEITRYGDEELGEGMSFLFSYLLRTAFGPHAGLFMLDPVPFSPK